MEEVNGTGFSQTASVSHRQYNSTNSPSHLNLRAARPNRTNGRRLGTLQKRRCLGNREALNREGFHFSSVLKGLSEVREIILPPHLKRRLLFPLYVKICLLCCHIGGVKAVWGRQTSL